MKKYIAFFMSALFLAPVSQAGLLDNVVTVVNKVSEVAGATQGTSSDKKTNRRTNTNTTSTNTGSGIQNIVTAKDVSNNKPQSVSNRFPNDLVRIYLCFDYSGLKSGDVIKVLWYTNSSNGNLTKIYESQMTVNTTSGFGEFHIKLPQNTKWPIGSYRVDVMLNIGLAGSVNFEVYDASASSSTSSTTSSSSTSSTSSSSSGGLLDQILSLTNTTEPSTGTTKKTTAGQQNTAAKTQAQQSGQQQQQNWPGQVGDSSQQQGGQQQNPGMQAVAPAAAGVPLYYGNPEGGTCKEAGYDYSVQYLNGWKYIKQSKNTIKFINFDEDANVVIQNIIPAANGGKYNTKEEILNDIKNQLAGMPSYSIISEGEHNVNNIAASQFVVSYMLGSTIWQEWYLCIPKPNGKMFYLFCYRAYQKVYSKYLGSARIMLASFTPLDTEAGGIAQPKQQSPQGGTAAPQPPKSGSGDDFSF